VCRAIRTEQVPDAEQKDVVVRSVEWTLLEWVVPVATWLHLEVGPIPQVTIALVALLVVGALIAAVWVANGAARAARVPVVFAPRPRPVPRDRWASAESARPMGGNGPRAPAVADIRIPAV